jgi:chemotaxis response regulator CheB
MPAKKNNAGEKRQDQNRAKKRYEGKKHLVVVVGASAGGLEALKHFLGPLRLADYVAFAVIQHLRSRLSKPYARNPGESDIPAGKDH